jgi:hypothetical protein
MAYGARTGIGSTLLALLGQRDVVHSDVVHPRLDLAIRLGIVAAKRAIEVPGLSGTPKGEPSVARCIRRYSLYR